MNKTEFFPAPWFPGYDHFPEYKHNASNYFLWIGFLLYPVWIFPLIIVFTHAGAIITVVDHQMVGTSAADFIKKWFDETWIEHLGLVIPYPSCASPVLLQVGAIGIIALCSAAFSLIVCIGATTLKWVVRQRTPVGEHSTSGMFYACRALIQNIQSFAWERCCVPCVVTGCGMCCVNCGCCLCRVPSVVHACPVPVPCLFCAMCLSCVVPFLCFVPVP